MSLILNIDTATEHASVCFAKEGTVLAIIESGDQKNHAAFVQPAIKALKEQLAISLQAVDAVAVTAGPGSYTGLRVGMATAKGICYAIQKPLILVNTLEVMAQAMLSHARDLILPGSMLCPLIDARRMEVFCAVFDTAIKTVAAARAEILEPGAFAGLLEQQPVHFSGSGAAKLKALISHPNAYFHDIQHTAAELAQRAEQAFLGGCFADLAYAEPFYIKEFFNPPPRSK